MPSFHRIAYFISPHGYGHAARGSAVMAAIHAIAPTVHFDVYTHIPQTFFEESLNGPFTFHSLLTDIGVVQESSLVEDLTETVRRLDEWLPFDPAQVKSLAEAVKGAGCGMIVCDIAPLGIAVAREAGLPSVLVENFTWDWIYEGYLQHEAGLSRHIIYLREVFQAADYRIQTEPLCQRQPAALSLTSPISRKPRTPIEQIRQQLEIPGQAKAVLITLGGIRSQYAFLERLESQYHVHFIIPGATERVGFSNNLRLLPHHSDFYHPDLINAADLVVGKLGYSTLAEAYHAGLPYGYIARHKSPEMKALVNYVEARMSGLAIPTEQFQDGRWLTSLPELLALPRVPRNEPNGADRAAHFILARLNES